MSLQMFKKKEPELPLKGVKHIVGVAAGKGGVGKSTVSVNLALALKKMGFTVGLLDADIYGPSLRKMLPEDRLPARRGEMIVPALAAGLHLLSMAYFRKEGEAAAIRAPIANGIIKQFIHQADWGDLDFLIVDFPPGTGDVQLTLAQELGMSAALIVTTPQEIALQDVKRAIDLFEQVRVPILGVVENMSHYIPFPGASPCYPFGRGGGRRLAETKGFPFLGEIPIDSEISRLGDLGVSLFQEPKALNAATNFLGLAEMTIEHLRTLSEESEECLSNFELTWRST